MNQCGQQFPATKAQIRAVNILVKHPGLTAQGFAAIAYPSWHRAGWLGALKLWLLTNNNIVKVRWEPRYHKAGRIKPRKRYYVTSLGYAIYESYRRQGYSEDGDPPDNYGAGGESDGGSIIRRTVKRPRRSRSSLDPGRAGSIRRTGGSNPRR